MPLNNVNILQWNCRSLQRRIPDLLLLLEDLSIDIVAICETRLDDAFCPSFANYDIYSVNRNRRGGGGIGILINKNLRFTFVKDGNIETICKRNDIEFLLGKIWLKKDKHLFVCSLYSPPRGNNHAYTERDAWSLILQYCSRLDPILVCGDVNGKSSLWANGILGPDVEGRKLEAAITNSDLLCLNNGEFTWQSTDLSSASSLDITLSSSSIAHKCTWRVLDANYGSDHFPIVITINEFSMAPDFGRPSFSTANLDWSSFHNCCCDLANSFTIDHNDLNSSYDKLIDSLHHALLTSGAVKYSANKHLRRTPSPWWDEECSLIIRNKLNVFKTFKQYPSSDNLQNYIDSCKQVSKLFKKKKKQSFQQFCSSLNMDTPIPKVWRYIRAFANKRLRNTTQTIVSEDSFLEAFNKLAPLTPPPHLSDWDLDELINIPFEGHNVNKDFLLRPFSAKEYYECVSSLKIKSAPGPDLISNQIIKKLPQELHIIILKLFNIMFNKGVYPTQWNNYFTVFIPKPGNKKSLRPISLANNLHKIFEKLLLWRIEWWAENCNIL